MRHSNRPIRPLLLFLLWIWAACVFFICDLFLNVEEFDRARPRAQTYRAMRFVAHRMVGEPYLERDEFAAPPTLNRPTPTHRDLAQFCPSSVRPGTDGGGFIGFYDIGRVPGDDGDARVWVSVRLLNHGTADMSDIVVAVVDSEGEDHASGRFKAACVARGESCDLGGDLEVPPNKAKRWRETSPRFRIEFNDTAGHTIRGTLGLAYAPLGRGNRE